MTPFVANEGHPDRTDTQRHEVAIGLSLRDVMERLLIPMRITSSRDSQQITGLLLQLSRALERDPDEPCTVYRMSPVTGRERGVDASGKVTNLFQGQAPVNPPARRGEVYPGDQAIREDDQVSVQIHVLDLTRDGAVVRENVPVLAVWVPARLAVGWIDQGPTGTGHMTGAGLFGIYEGVAVPDGDEEGTPLFATRLVPGHESYFVGKDTAGQACLLMETIDEARRKPPPIRLESLDAQFELACQITVPGGQIREALFTVVRCRSLDVETIRYFLSVCRIIMRHLGDAPSRTALAAAVRRIASIFQNVRKPPDPLAERAVRRIVRYFTESVSGAGGCHMAERREITVRLCRRRCPHGCEELCRSGPHTHVFLRSV